MISSMLLTMHLVLFGVKLWAVMALIESMKKYKFIILVSIIYLAIQTWFLYCFFLDIDLYYYEIISILDQCIFTIGLIFYLTKEVKNGARKNQRRKSTT